MSISARTTEPYTPKISSRCSAITLRVRFDTCKKACSSFFSAFSLPFALSPSLLLAFLSALLLLSPPLLLLPLSLPLPFLALPSVSSAPVALGSPDCAPALLLGASAAPAPSAAAASTGASLGSSCCADFASTAGIMKGAREYREQGDNESENKKARESQQSTFASATVLGLTKARLYPQKVRLWNAAKRLRRPIKKPTRRQTVQRRREKKQREAKKRKETEEKKKKRRRRKRKSGKVLPRSSHSTLTHKPLSKHTRSTRTNHTRTKHTKHSHKPLSKYTQSAHINHTPSTPSTH